MNEKMLLRECLREREFFSPKRARDGETFLEHKFHVAVSLLVDL
jgi:hypothetical protein